jgi:hypothetical protein
LLFRLLKRPRGYSDSQRLEDYKVTFSSPAGRRVLADLASECSFWEASAVTDPTVIAMEAGARALFQHMLRWTEVRRIEDLQED